MKKIIDILQARDGLTQQEATDRINEVIEMIRNSGPFEAEEIFINELGLEIDYLLRILHLI